MSLDFIVNLDSYVVDSRPVNSGVRGLTVLPVG
jgi:hypothetical protein